MDQSVSLQYFMAHPVFFAGQSSLVAFFWAHPVPASDDGVSITARSRPTVLIRRPSSLGGYPVVATSAFLLQLDMPRTQSRTVGDRAFADAGPTLWNSLPHDITDCVSLTSFCRKLEIFFCFLYHFHDYIFLSSGHWGFYLSHFKNFLCMYVWMYVCILCIWSGRWLGAFWRESVWKRTTVDAEQWKVWLVVHCVLLIPCCIVSLS